MSRSYARTKALARWASWLVVRKPTVHSSRLTGMVATLSREMTLPAILA